MSTESPEQHPGSSPDRPPRPIRRWASPIGIVILLACSAFGLWRIVPGREGIPATSKGNRPVAVVPVQRENLVKDVMVQAEFRPFQEVDLHSKVAGFLATITVDLGDQVTAGQILATLEVPELADDLKRAHALEQRSLIEVQRAESAYGETHVAYTRLAAVNQAQPNLIAQQDLDTALAKDHQAAATLAGARQQVEVARAETSKLNTLAQYSRIAAPFAGVITKRSADPGALIPAAISSGTPAPLLRVSQLDRLRLVFPVSMSYVSLVHPGTALEIHVQNQDQPLAGTVARISQKIETATRTMDAEVDVPNPELKLIPGMYASVVIQLERHEQVLTLPIQAVARDQTPTVYLINSAQVIEERKVKLGLQTPIRVEILAGLEEGDRVMMGSRGQVRPGQKVEPKLITIDKEQP